jgi:multidrug efflux pump
VVGEFMKYLPITVIACLTASLAMALIFAPVLGGLIGKFETANTTHLRTLVAAESGDLNEIGGFTGRYLKLLRRLLRHPGKVLLVAIALLIGAYVGYGKFGRGVEFFPDIEPEIAQVQIHARGDLSIQEKDALTQTVESRLLDMPEIESIYARTQGGGGNSGGQEQAEDVVGVLQLEFIDWQLRRPANQILDEVREHTADIAGVIIETRKQENGPSGGKPIQIQISARDPAQLTDVVTRLRALMNDIGGFKDVEDDRPLPGIEWRLKVNREEAARYGVDVSLLGNAVQMVTNGILVADYRPDDSDEEVDIRVRFPFGARNMDQLDQLRVPTPQGAIPITNFVSFEPAPKTGTLKRSEGQRVMTLKADVAEGLLVDDKVRELRTALMKQTPEPGIQVKFKGQDQDQRETMTFLMKAFFTAIFLMALFLVTQFNSVYQTLLVMSAIIFSSAGVLLGLLVTAQPFGIVMCGIGLIALAGIVVNNNIILIDTFNDLKKNGMAPLEAALRTGAQRLRPVFLTSFTTVLGLIPMVFSLNIDLLTRDISVGAPSTQWWTQLSSAIAGGLTFATLLTLLLTPCLLMLGENTMAWIRARRERRAVKTGISTAA